MTQEEIIVCLSQGEGVRIEFKQAESGMPPSLYETIVSFSNKDGGTILLGIADNGTVYGVNPANMAEMKQNITSACNNPEFMNPQVSLTPIQVEYEGKLLLVLKIPVSSQVHKLNGVIYDRENDSDIKITDHARISDMYFRKRDIFTETKIYPAVTWNDLRSDLFDKVRTIIRGADPAHPWLAMSNEELMRSATLYTKDYKTGEEGFSLAGVLIFGRDNVIQNILSAYKVEALVRRDNLDRWDDRLTLRTNLIETYLQLMDFIRKHLPSKFYLEGDQRKDIRDIIFRELIGNILCHREYTSHYSTELIIYKDKVVATNPNKALFHGVLDIHSFNPFPKNPNIRKFFAALSWADEIGSGVRNMTKYIPFYVSKNARPLFVEDDVFKTEVPLIVHTWQAHSKEFVSIFEPLKDECRERMIANLTSVSVCGEQPGFEEFLTEKVSSWSQKGVKLANSRIFVDQDVTKNKIEKVLSSTEKGVKLFDKRTEFVLKMLILMVSPMPLARLMESLGYSNRQKFRELYLLPLIKDGLVSYTIPDKPTSEKQQYVITERGKLFLGGFEI